MIVGILVVYVTSRLHCFVGSLSLKKANVYYYFRCLFSKTSVVQYSIQYTNNVTMVLFCQSCHRKKNPCSILLSCSVWCSTIKLSALKAGSKTSLIRVLSYSRTSSNFLASIKLNTLSTSSPIWPFYQMKAKIFALSVFPMSNLTYVFPNFKKNNCILM